MKKNRLLLSFLILVLGCLSFNAVPYTADELVSIARQAAKKAAYTVMNKVSLGTGMDQDYDIDYESIIYDPYEKELEFQVTLSWSVMRHMLFCSRDTCKTWGKNYVDLSRGKSEMEARYVSKGKNHWCQVCEDSHELDVFATPIDFVIAN